MSGLPIKVTIVSKLCMMRIIRSGLRIKLTIVCGLRNKICNLPSAMYSMITNSGSRAGSYSCERVAQEFLIYGLVIEQKTDKYELVAQTSCSENKL